MIVKSVGKMVVGVSPEEDAAAETPLTVLSSLWVSVEVVLVLLLESLELVFKEKAGG